MNIFFRRVPLPVKLMMMGLIPFLVLVYISLQLYNSKNLGVKLIQDYKDRIHLSADIYSLINHLQNERKYSFDNALKKDSANDLTHHRAKTDSAIRRLESGKYGPLIGFTHYTFLDKLDHIRSLSDSNKIEPAYLMNYYTTAIFRINSQNVIFPGSDIYLKPLYKKLISQKLLSEMIMHLGILRSNIYNTLFEKENMKETLLGSAGVHDIWKSYETEFLLKGSPEAIAAYQHLRRNTALRPTVEYLDSLFTNFQSDSTFAAKDWWDISNTGLEGLKKLRQDTWKDASVNMDKILKNEQSKRDRALVFLLVTLLIVVTITVYTIYNINKILTELKVAAEAISEGVTGIPLKPVSTDVIGSLTESILKIDLNNKLLTDAAEKIGNGNFAVDMPRRSKEDLLGNALVKMKNNLQEFARVNEDSAQQLRQMAEKYKAIFYKSPLPKWIFDNQTLQFLEVNDAAVNHYGYTRAEFLQMTIRDIRPQPEHAKFEEHIKLEKPDRYSSTGYWLHKKKDGNIIKVDISAHMIDYENRQARLVIVNDVTERMNAEEEIFELHGALAEREQRFRAMIENNNEIIALEDENAEMIYRSPSSERITGWSNEEIKEIKNASLVHPDDLEYVKEIYLSALSNPGISVPLTLRFRHKKGNFIWLEGVMTNMLKDASIKGMVSNFKDITERKIVEEQLIKSEKIYKTIASSIPGSLICLLDHEYRYLLIEGDMLEKFGYSKENLLGNKAIDVLPMERYVPLLPSFKRVFNDEIFSIHTNRGGYDVITKFVPLKDENNKVYAAMTVGMDISELKNAERYIHELNAGLEQKVEERTAQLEIVNKELEAFTYSVSHDLRAPLRIIDGFADILISDYGKSLDGEGIRVLNVIMNNAQRMGQLIDDLLNLSRLGRKDVSVSAVDMNYLVQTIIDDQQFLKHTNAKIEKNNLLPAYCDPSLITQVWSNLLSNALKYSGKVQQPYITISSWQQADEVIYSIKDNGVGFNMQYAGNLFGVFQRLHKATEFEGTGVGLALVQRIILKHNGKLWAEAAVNKGATFFFSLPVNIPIIH